MIHGLLTTRMETVRVDGALRALGELDGGEDVRGLCLEIR